MSDFTTRDLIVRNEPLPAALLDLDALHLNSRTIVSCLGPGQQLRLATKSLRCLPLLRHLVDRSPSIQGLMTYSAHETLVLARSGFSDLLLAYPVARPVEAQALATAAAEGSLITAMVDDTEQIDLIAAAAQAQNTTIQLCLDLDVSLRLLRGSVHLGVRRSPLHTTAQAIALADHIRRTNHVELSGVMAYEAQVASLPDQQAGDRIRKPVRSWLKRRSIRLAQQRRAATVTALEQAGHMIKLVNGGGTGSLNSTSQDPVVTEITAGSGFYATHLFNGYDNLHLQPALTIGVSVVRHPAHDIATCFSGGFIASGPPDASRQPRVLHPAHLRPLALEGFGEVQTPLQGKPRPELGSVVWLQPAKAGEPLERFSEVLVMKDGTLIDRWPTYRGQGWAFG